MAITDNIIYRMQAAAGQTNPTNEVGASEVLTGAATISLEDAGAEKAWRFLNGAASTTLTTGASYVGATDGAGMTLAVRMRVNTYPTGSFDSFVEIRASDSSYRFQVTRGGASNNRARWFDTAGYTAAGATINNDIKTVVIRLKCLAAAASDSLDLWYEQVGRSGTAPDSTSASQNWPSSKTFNQVRVAPDSTNQSIDILDFIIWGRELSDAEASAVADGIRTELPLLGASSPTITDAGRAYTGLGTIGQGNGFGYKRF